MEPQKNFLGATPYLESIDVTLVDHMLNIVSTRQRRLPVRFLRNDVLLGGERCNKSLINFDDSSHILGWHVYQWTWIASIHRYTVRVLEVIHCWSSDTFSTTRYRTNTNVKDIHIQSLFISIYVSRLRGWNVGQVSRCSDGRFLFCLLVHIDQTRRSSSWKYKQNCFILASVVCAARIMAFGHYIERRSSDGEFVDGGAVCLQFSMINRST